MVLRVGSGDAKESLRGVHGVLIIFTKIPFIGKTITVCVIILVKFFIHFLYTILKHLIAKFLSDSDSNVKDL